MSSVKQTEETKLTSSSRETVVIRTKKPANKAGDKKDG